MTEPTNYRIINLMDALRASIPDEAKVTAKLTTYGSVVANGEMPKGKSAIAAEVARRWGVPLLVIRSPK